jgi:hypothetical protein
MPERIEILAHRLGIGVRRCRRYSRALTPAAHSSPILRR